MAQRTKVPRTRPRVLRDYQAAAVAEIVRHLTARPGSKFLIQMPTGSGKTIVADEGPVLSALTAGKRVLWVTKDWWLIRQAVDDLLGAHPELRQHTSRVGGGKELPEIPEGAHGRIVYSTVHTLAARMEELQRQRFDIVVVDEVHWGEGGPMYRAIEKRLERTALFIGLTATPRAWSDYETIVRVAFDDLVKAGHLAKPILEKGMETGVAWRPELSGANGDFTPSSLRRLARSRKRNARIVSAWVENRVRYGKTLVFACNIEHAEQLKRLFVAAGVSAEAVHSAMTSRQQSEVLERFRAREGFTTDVLVNVAKATHGVDIPELRTIFLARPTASDILFVQMAGRGARIHPGKKTFRLVDFVDVLEAHGDKLLQPSDFYGSQGVSRKSRPVQRRGEGRTGAKDRFPFEPAPVQRYRAEPGYRALDGLELQPAQSFGVEFEITRSGFRGGEKPADWTEVAGALLAAIENVAGRGKVARRPMQDGHDPRKSHQVWNVEWDGSCGWEVTSRVLRGEEGIRELHDVARGVDRAATELGLTVDYRTGTHVHLGWGEPTLERLRLLHRWVAFMEPALYSLVAPSRFGNGYCKSIRSHWKKLRRIRTLGGWEKHFEPEGARYLVVNSGSLFSSLGTLEVRMHSGTLEGPKILTWISLWMRLLDAVDRGVEPPEDVTTGRAKALSADLEGDVVRILARLGAGHQLLAALDARRRDVVGNRWKKIRSRAKGAKAALAAWDERRVMQRAA